MSASAVSSRRAQDEEETVSQPALTAEVSHADSSQESIVSTFKGNGLFLTHLKRFRRTHPQLMVYIWFLMTFLAAMTSFLIFLNLQQTSKIPTTATSSDDGIVPAVPWKARNNTEYWMSLHDYLLPLLSLSSSEDGTASPVVTPGSSQWKALRWLATKDPLELTSEDDYSRRRLVNRYALAVLYFSSNGPQTWRMATPASGWFRFVGAVDRDGMVTVVGVAEGEEGKNESSSGDEEETLSNSYTLGGFTALAGENKEEAEEEQVDKDLSVGSDVEGEEGSPSAPLTGLTGRFPVPLSECEWFGVECNEQDEIIELDLGRSSFALPGAIPKELALLSHLTSLDLAGHDLKGRFPPELFPALTSLTNLNVQKNQLTVLEEGIGYWTNLERLDWSQNRLQGTLPSEALSKLSNLRHLLLRQNLDLSGNLWHGMVPNMPKLETLDISSTLLSGSIPEIVPGGPLSRLRVLLANNCQLTGTLPATLAVATNLQALGLGMLLNLKPRPFPAELGKLTELRVLNVFETKAFSGSLPTEIGLLTSLERLDFFKNNRIRGQLPTQVGFLTKLIFLDLSRTGLSGTIPTELGSLRNLGNLQLHKTQLTGTMPEEVCDLGLLGLTASCLRTSPSANVVVCSPDCCSECL